MTILLFLPNNSPFLLLDSDQSPELLAAMINSNLWHPPADFRAWLLAQGQTPSHMRVCASQHENLVIISPGSGNHAANSANNLPDRSGLTRRQREVLQGLLSGKTSRQMAAQLGIHQRTVIWHINQLKKRLGTQTLVQSVGQMAALNLEFQSIINRG